MGLKDVRMADNEVVCAIIVATVKSGVMGRGSSYFCLLSVWISCGEPTVSKIHQTRNLGGVAFSEPMIGS